MPTSENRHAHLAISNKSWATGGGGGTLKQAIGEAIALECPQQLRYIGDKSVTLRVREIPGHFAIDCGPKARNGQWAEPSAAGYNEHERTVDCEGKMQPL